MKTKLLFSIVTLIITITVNAQNVGVGTTTPQSKLSVGANSQFQVDSVGNIKKINNVATSFPATQGGNEHSLVTDSLGNLSWTSKGKILYATVSGVNNIVLSTTTKIINYTEGMMISFKAIGANTGNATININGVALKPLYKNATVQLTANDMIAGQIYTAIYDGTNFQLTNANINNQTGSGNGSNALTLFYLNNF